MEDGTHTRIRIDGSFGEGGGQILRSALGLSAITGKPFEIEKIRARRRKPGLLRQHLTAVHAAKTLTNATVHGDELGSKFLVFEPGTPTPGDYHFAVGSAGSATLVFQAILPPLLVAGRSRVIFEGGTHNPWAPPFSSIEKAFLPILRRMGAPIEARLEKHGFYPAGGGRFVVDVGEPSPLSGIDIDRRDKIVKRRAIAKVAQLEPSIARRELDVVADRLGFDRSELIAMQVQDSIGPGNILTIEFEDAAGSHEVFTGFGEVRRSAEVVAAGAVRDARNWLKADVPVGVHLADQLMIPFAMAGSGSFRTLPLSRHSLTNLTILEKFLDVPIEVQQEGRNAVVRFGGTPK
ncbi:MAG: RNA 3'-terminal phosphate cyclase [Planctomycetes bacterium]|nr:RNA 3'-terminal phosphate cyclase [Planctomycetota bacterium]